MASEKELESNRELRAQLEPLEQRARVLGEALTGELRESLAVNYAWSSNGTVKWTATLEVTIGRERTRPGFASVVTRVLAYAEGYTMPEAAEDLLRRLTEKGVRRAVELREVFREEAAMRGDAE